MELPSGGHAWHQLRSGYLPEEFTSHLSCDLLDIIKWMIHPQPQLRPTADQILNHPTVCRMSLQKKYSRYYHKTAAFMARWCSTMWGGLLKLIMLIASIIPCKDHMTPAEEHITPSTMAPPLISYSDTEEELNDSFSDDPSDHHMNKSWLNDSPVRFHSPVYSGPPIPLNFGDVDDGHNSSFDSHLNTSLE